MNGEHTRRRDDTPHRRANENGVRGKLPAVEWKLSVGGLLNTVLTAGILGILAWGSSAIETLNANKAAIERINDVQARVVSTQAKVVETLTDIKTSFAVLNERNLEHARRLQVLEVR